MLKNAHLLAKTGADTAESEPSFRDKHLANVGQTSQNEAHGPMGEVLTEGTVDIRMPDDDGPAAKWSTAATLTGLPR